MLPEHPRGQRLEALAREHGWRVTRDEAYLPGWASGGYSLAFSVELPSGRAFAFVVAFAVRRTTGRWSALQVERGYPVQGHLLPGDGSARDEVAQVWGAPLETRLWRTLRSLEGNLAHPERLAAWEWVGEAPEPLTAKAAS